MSEDVMSDEAIDWAVRVSEPAFEDWEAFTMWLEADPAHGEAYEAALAASEAADPVLASRPAVAQTRMARTPSRRWGWLGAGSTALAASVAGLIAWTSAAPRTDPYLIETAPGSRQQVAVGGVKILINGGTRIWLDHRNPRVATIERGEALFDVLHDVAHPFTVHVGDTELQDVGTRFDVTRDARQMRVAVAEGAVLFNPGREGVRIDAGKALSIDGGGRTAELQPIATQTVGGWREGRFAYVATPIATIAADLTRSTGIGFAVDPGVATMPFTGVVSYNDDRKAFLAELGPLLGVRIAPREGRWIISRTRIDG